MKLEENPMLTDWFPPDVKPVYIGVYQTKMTGTDGFIHKQKFSLWTGEKWMDSAITVTHAANRRFIGFQQKKWRGLAKKP